MKLREPLPSLVGATYVLNGNLDQTDIEGKLVFIHFWAVSCKLCKNAMKNINEFKEKYGEEMVTISIHTPRCEEDFNLQAIKEAMSTHNMYHLTLVDNDQQLKEAFENKCVPTYYLFDKEGKLRHYQAGGSSMSMLERRLQRFLEEGTEDVF